MVENVKEQSKIAHQPPPAKPGVAAVEVKREFYAIHTYSGYEERVKKNLDQRIKSMGAEDEIFQVIIPTEEEVEIKGDRINYRVALNPEIFYTHSKN